MGRREASNFDIGRDIVPGPLFAYVGKSPGVFKCTADKSSVVLTYAFNSLPAGSKAPRVRTISMSQVFSTGEWLTGNFQDGQTDWRVYKKTSDLLFPATTFVFVDENPGSINDAAFAWAATGNTPADPPVPLES